MTPVGINRQCGKPSTAGRNCAIERPLHTAAEKMLRKFGDRCSSGCGGGSSWLAMVGRWIGRARLGVCKLEHERKHIGRQYGIHYVLATFAERAAELFKDMISTVWHGTLAFPKLNAGALSEFQ